MDRRNFLKSGAGAFLGCRELAFLTQLTPVSSTEARVDPLIVRFHPAIEPLVRLLEETAREKLFEEVGARIKQGLTYREVLAALLLAGIRNVQPRPNVGFQFHTVLVAHSAHLVAQASPETDRWLPLFWTLDEFKRSQAVDARAGDWTMGAVNANAVPSKEHAVRAFTDAMEQWDESLADTAAAGLARSVSPREALEIFARYAARDFRAIGHKAIYVANAFRTLDTIGWQHSEPVLRSLAYALLAREGSDPLKGDARVDRPWRHNQSVAKRMRPDWHSGRVDGGATAEMVAVLRDATEEETTARVADALGRGIAPASIWDALMCSAAEVLMRNPGVVPLHAVTTTNAIRYLFERSQNDETRRLLLLQNAAFIPFLRGGGSNARIDELVPLEPSSGADDGVSDILATISRDRPLAARKVLRYLAAHPSPKSLLDAANRLVFLKGNDSHDYKFSAAVLEDYEHLSPPWRSRFLAASVFWLSGSGAPDNELVQRARNAL